MEKQVGIKLEIKFLDKKVELKLLMQLEEN